MTVKLPNFFILGAPKCGTTSLAAWLGEHENIYISPVKEPNYFNTDVKLVGRMSDGEYRSLFRGATSIHQAIGEATTGYLRSTVAIGRILEHIPDARFIVCVRNPVDMAVSFHGEMVKSGIETETDFSAAWDLQEARCRGRQVPRLCLHKEDLLYGPICKVGEQVERVVRLVGMERVLLVVLDDMKVDPKREYRRVLDFLKVRDDGRSHFPVENQALSLPLRVAGALRAAQLVKRKLRLRRQTGGVTVVRRLFGRTDGKPELPVSLQHELVEYFRADIEKLEKILGRDLGGWLTGRNA